MNREVNFIYPQEKTPMIVSSCAFALTERARNSPFIRADVLKTDDRKFSIILFTDNQKRKSVVENVYIGCVKDIEISFRVMTTKKLIKETKDFLFKGGYYPMQAIKWIQRYISERGQIGGVK